jgi:hypothetical protein
MMVRLVKRLRTRRTISPRGSTDPRNRVALRPSRTYLDNFSIRQRGNPQVSRAVFPLLILFLKTRDSQANGAQCGRALDEGAPSLLPPPSPPCRSPHYCRLFHSIRFDPCCSEHVSQRFPAIFFSRRYRDLGQDRTHINRLKMSAAGAQLSSDTPWPSAVIQPALPGACPFSSCRVQSQGKSERKLGRSRRQPY